MLSKFLIKHSRIIDLATKKIHAQLLPWKCTLPTKPFFLQFIFPQNVKIKVFCKKQWIWSYWGVNIRFAIVNIFVVERLKQSINSKLTCGQQQKKSLELVSSTLVFSNKRNDVLTLIFLLKEVSDFTFVNTNERKAKTTNAWSTALLTKKR